MPYQRLLSFCFFSISYLFFFLQTSPSWSLLEGLYHRHGPQLDQPGSLPGACVADTWRESGPSGCGPG